MMDTHGLVVLIDWIGALAAVYGRYGTQRITVHFAAQTVR